MQSHNAIANGISSVSWFDVVVIAWLIFGFVRGRKNGMSVEILLVLQWVAIVVAGALTYVPIGVPLAVASGFSSEWACRISYALVAIVTGSIMARFKTMVTDKLVGADLFGKGEYILGMMAGVFRFACMVIVFLALFGAHVPTAQEIAAVNTKTKDLGKVSINPLQIQREIILESKTGQFSRDYLKLALIIPPEIKTQAKPPADTIAKKREKAVDAIMTPSPISVTPSK